MATKYMRVNGIYYLPYNGTAFDDNILTTNERAYVETFAGKDTVIAGAGDDMIKTGLDDDIVYAGAGNDAVLGGGGNDILYGGPGNDYLNTETGDWNRLIGGPGNDNIELGMYSPAAVDTAEFDFITKTVRVSETYAQWLTNNGYSQYVLNGYAADGIPQDDFVNTYKGWLTSLVIAKGIGFDENGDGVIDVGAAQNRNNFGPNIEGVSKDTITTMFADPDQVAVQTGVVQHDRYYYNEFYTTTTTVGTDDGLDMVTFFDSNDLINFKGLTQSQWNKIGHVEVKDFTADGKLDTFVGANDHSWGLTLVGYSASVANNIVFG